MMMSRNSPMLYDRGGEVRPLQHLVSHRCLLHEPSRTVEEAAQTVALSYTNIVLTKGGWTVLGSRGCLSGV